MASMTFTAYVLDTETTGTDPIKNDVIELCIWRLNEDVGKLWHFKPFSIENIEDEALEVNGHKRQDLIWKTSFGKETYKDPSVVLPEIEEWIMSDGAAASDRIIIGQNPDFDYQFLINLWKKAGSEHTFPFGSWTQDGRNLGFLLDTIQIARLIDLFVGRRRNAYNLSALVKDFGVTKSTAHRADGDVKMTRDLFIKMTNPIKEILSNEFKS
jgi:DNA polymerase III epsilon subunit-like protein